MKPVILARLRMLIDAWPANSSYRKILAGKNWAILLVRRDDKRINPADWARKAGE